MKKPLIILLAILFILPTATSWSGVYKYRDKSGSLHFVDSPDKIPEEYRDKKEELRFKDTKFSGQSYDSNLKGKTFEEIMDLAERGRWDAQFEIGFAYKNGIGVKKNTAEAIKWYSKAAEQGCAVAQYNLGLIYRRGDGITFDYDKAKVYFRSAAKQGYADAQTNLAAILGMQGQHEESFEWYMKAAENGDAIGMNAVGDRYEKGIGVKRDLDEAKKWHQRAFEAGFDRLVVDDLSSQ